MSTTTIREATPADYDAVGELIVAVYIGEGYVPEGSGYAALLARTAERAANSDVIVAERDGVIVGTITLALPGSPYAPIARADELEFRMLAVAKAARGLGIGRALVDHVVDRVRRDGYRGVSISTSREMVDARRLYNAMGFVHVRERDWEPEPGTHLTVLVSA